MRLSSLASDAPWDHDFPRAIVLDQYMGIWDCDCTML